MKKNGIVPQIKINKDEIPHVMSDDELQEECTINGELDTHKYIRALIDRDFTGKLHDFITGEKYI